MTITYKTLIIKRKKTTCLACLMLVYLYSIKLKDCLHTHTHTTNSNINKFSSITCEDVINKNEANEENVYEKKRIFLQFITSNIIHFEIEKLKKTKRKTYTGTLFACLLDT
jgi:hypothetical protein